jgi:CheY-like chemotaxis protein
METPSNQTYQILVVDDEPMVCRALKLLLEFDRHEVQTVESGEAALALFELNHFDLIITDYSLGLVGMKGDQLAATIKQRWPDQPIIMATAFAADFPPSSKPSGCVDYVLSKPFSLIELRAAIACVMSLNKSPNPSASALDPTEVPPPDVPPPAHPDESSSGRKWT